MNHTPTTISVSFYVRITTSLQYHSALDKTVTNQMLGMVVKWLVISLVPVITKLIAQESVVTRKTWHNIQEILHIIFDVANEWNLQ